MPPLRWRSRWLLVAVSSALVALALPSVAMNASAAETRVVVPGLRSVATTDVVVDHTITTSFDLALSSAHQRELNAFLAGLSNTASPHYHHFLTPREYARRYGATPTAIAAVRSYLASYGLRVGGLSAGHNLLHVAGTTTDIARAFDAPVETIRLSDGSLDAHFLRAASLPHALAHDVTAVAGLSNVRPETTDAVPSKVANAPSECVSAGTSTGTTPNSVGGYTVQQQGELYGFDNAWAAGDTGVGQTIGVYELATYDASDVSTFFNCYAIAPSVTQTNVDGGPSVQDNADNAPDEATLDVEEAAALAPGAGIEVYQGTQAGGGPTDIYSQMASDNTASIVTTSWGICEAQTDGGAFAEHAIFEEMAAQGQTVIAAAGDDGSSDCEGTPQPTKGLAVDDPASQPFVTGVGGLTVSDIAPLSESVWNDNCTSPDCGSGGGGESTLWSRPSWQSGDGIDTAADTRRMVPDLSVMGDPTTGFIQYFTGTDTGFCHHSCSGGWGGIGGTSIGAPLVSALVAVAAQSCTTLAGGRLGFINPSLYAMATTDFIDVTTGNNDLFGEGNYSAGTGYDMASGLGSPNSATFIAGLCPVALSTSESSFALSSPTSTAKSLGPTISATLRDANNLPVANASLNVTATAPGGALSINNVSDANDGVGSASGSVTSDATGRAIFTVSSSIAQRVTVVISYAGASIYSAVLTFRASPARETVPSPPIIARLAPLVGGFALTLKPPVRTGDSAITTYEYSLNGGKSWIVIAKDRRSINVLRLARHAIYHVTARAFNAVGASKASAAKKVVTRS